ncbi:response regulator transcription factor [Streptomyces exfoliatus]|uniref:response regulator transcription factor n=1 Tax=Streptomyces exfoliatus TaxID=1905 RepID=UPI00379D0359
MSDTSARGKSRRGPCVEDEESAAHLLSCEAGLLDAYRSRLVEERNPLGLDMEAWDSVCDRVHGILNECWATPGTGAGASGEPRSVRLTGPRGAGRIARGGAVSVHAVRAGSLLVEVVAEYLERSLTLRSSGAPSAVRLPARVQAAVTRSLTDGAEGADAPGRTDADDRACGADRADECDHQLLDVVRDSTRRSREAMAREIHDRVGSAAGLALRRLELHELTRGDSSAVMIALPCGATSGTAFRGAARQPLSPREREVLMRVAEALSNRQIAVLLGITEATVKRHLRNIFEKPGAASRIGAVNKALEARLIDPAGKGERQYAFRSMPDAP